MLTVLTQDVPFICLPLHIEVPNTSLHQELEMIREITDLLLALTILTLSCCN